MFAPLARQLDRWVIHLASRRIHLQRPADSRCREAETMLASENLFAPAAAPVDGLNFRNRHAFTFESPIKTPFPPNNCVHGRFIDCGPGWRSRPVVVLLHGWNAEWALSTLFPAIATLLGRHQISSIALELPYHGHRRPPHPAPARDFISGDLAHMVQATRQAMADVRSVVRWAVDQGCPGIGLWGFSLGAWLAGLIGCHDPNVNALVLGTPIVDVAESVQDLPFCAPVRQSLSRSPLDLARLNLLLQRPNNRVRKILIIEALHDLFVRPRSVDNLAEAWTGSELWRVPHGHISIWLSRLVVRRSIDWLATSLQPDSRHPAAEAGRFAPPQD